MAACRSVLTADGRTGRCAGLILGGRPAVAFVDKGGNISVQRVADVKQLASGVGSYAASWAVYPSGDGRIVVVKQEQASRSVWTSVVDPVLGIKESWMHYGTLGKPTCVRGAHVGDELLIFCSIGATIEVWRPAPPTEVVAVVRSDRGLPYSATLSMAVVEVDGRLRLASIIPDSISDAHLELTDLDSGGSGPPAAPGPVLSIPRYLSAEPPAFVRMQSGCDLAYVGAEGVHRLVSVIDPLSGRELGTHSVATSIVDSLFPFDLGDMSLLAIGMDGGRVRVWYPRDDKVLCETEIHRGAITALCTVQIGERQLVASGGTDSAVRIWDPLTGEHVRSIPVHYPVGSLAFGRGVLAVALPTGVLALELDRPAIRTGI